MQNLRKPADTRASGDNLFYLLPFSLELIVFVGAGVSILFILTTLIVYALIRYALGKSLHLRWPNTVFVRALADAIQHKDCKNNHVGDTAIVLFAQCPLYLCYFS